MYFLYDLCFLSLHMMQKNTHIHLKEVGGDVICLPSFQMEKELCFAKTEKLSKRSKWEYVIQIEEFNSEWVFFF